MADTKISDLTAVTSLDGTEVIPIVQSGTTKKITIGTPSANTLADLEAIAASSRPDYVYMVDDLGNNGIDIPTIFKSDSVDWLQVLPGMVWKLPSPKYVCAPAATFTGTYTITNEGGFVGISSAGVHGMTNAAVQGKSFYVSAGTLTGWHIISDVNGSTTKIITTTAYDAAYTATTITLASTSLIPVFTVALPILQANSTIEYYVYGQNNSNTNSKRYVVTLGATDEFMNLQMNTTSLLSCNQLRYIKNQNSVSSQQGSWPKSNGSCFGTTSGTLPTSTLDTSVSKDLVFNAVVPAADDWVSFQDIYVKVYL